MEKQKECRGCKLLPGCWLAPNYTVNDYGDIEHCPCIDCIVKVLCEAGCERFKIYDNIRKQLSQIKEETYER